jgi:hypothetical protein
MPIYRYKCPVCLVDDSRLLTPAQSKNVKCRKTPGCCGVLERQVCPPTMTAKEIIDNGVMVRRVEQDIDGPRLVHEKASKDYTRAD